MILSGRRVSEEITNGGIKVDPFDARRVNPVSYDVTLGNKVAVYEGTCWYNPTNMLPSSMDMLGGNRVVRASDVVYEAFKREDGSRLKAIPVDRWGDFCLDAKDVNPIVTWTIGDKGWVLKPGIAYLMHTHEKVCAEKFVPILDGKSSIGRLFIKVHETAGFGDPGFDGQFTLEVTVQIPVRVYVGMRIGQVRFNQIDGEVTSYKTTGTYRGEAAEGPVASKAYKSAFQDKPTRSARDYGELWDPTDE